MDIPVSALRAASAAMAVTPAPLANVAARGIAAGIAGLSPDDRKIVSRNLQRAGVRFSGPLGEARAVQSAFDSYARYWVDVLRLPHLSKRAVDHGITLDGYGIVEDALASGTAPILALPHLGGWEWAGHWLSTVMGHKVAAVVEELEPRELYDWFVDLREGLGLNIIPLSEGSSAVAAAIADGQIMCLLCDRDISGGGIEVEFFGERTTLPGGPALMALRSGAPLLPAAVYFRGNGCHGVVQEPLDTERRGKLREDLTRVTQDLAQAMEGLIRAAPNQWHLLQPNWPSDYEALGRPVPGADRGR
ncbi:MAG: phosphatidylinositol mannoside acyltransferase [Actinomycetia bacterium]|nr:phosphatidylinositol mannoside acyltransferase [Actinomycetes bacterium]